MQYIILQVMGWSGTILIILAYFLVSFKKISAGSKAYQYFNFFGAVGVGANVLYHQAWPAVAMEAVWAVIAIAALVNIIRGKNI
jgi:cell division protein FtsW (lipid II flippase)